MPYVNFVLAQEVTPDICERTKAEMANILQKHAGKAESWLFIRFDEEQKLFFRGEQVSKGGVVQIQLVGSLAGDQKRKITAEVCEMLGKELGTPAEQIYVVFQEVKGENWGWNGQTFG